MRINFHRISISQKMAISFSPKSSTNSTAIPLLLSSSSSVIHFFASRYQSISPLHLHRPPLPKFHTRRRPCRVATPGPPPPPERDPDDNNSSLQLSGLASTLSRFQDTVRIFFAVLFWMSLFFWSSVWEGWNNDKQDKGPPFRR